MRVQVRDWESNEIVVADEELAIVCGDDEDAYLEALHELLHNGHCMIGGGAAPAYVLVWMRAD